MLLIRCCGRPPENKTMKILTSETPPLVQLWLFAIIMVFFSFVLEQGGLSTRIRSGLLTILQPTVAAHQNLQLQQQQFENSWILLNQGGQRLVNLENQLQAQQFDQAELKLLQRENSLLREQLGQRNESIQQYPRVRFYGRDGNFFINAGRNQNVQTNQLVFNEGVLVGLVTDVYANHSQVKTVTDQAWRFPVQIWFSPAGSRAALITGFNSDSDLDLSLTASPEANPTEDLTISTPGLWQNTRGYAEVIQVAQQHPIEVGDLVRTLGSLDLPPDYLVGRVVEVKAHPDGATWLLRVEPWQEISKIRVVEVRPR